MNDKDGNGGPRAVAADPRGGAPFCCVRVLWEYLSRYPPTRGGSLFSGIDTPLTDTLINHILLLVAIRLRLDPTRLVPDGLRVTGPVQLDICLSYARLRSRLTTVCDVGRWCAP